MVASKVLSILTVALIALTTTACAKRSPTTPEEELMTFAKTHGSEWVPVISSLQGRNPKLAEDSEKLSKEARELVRRFSISDSTLKEAPNLRHFPSLVELQLAGNGIEDISRLAGLQVTGLTLSSNRITDIAPLASCSNLEMLLLDHNPIKDISILNACAKLRVLHLAATEVRHLPDLSGLRSLKEFDLVSSTLESLDNLETIPGDFDLNIILCRNLQDIDALLTSRVKTLYIDKDETYPRFRPWFDTHLDEIKKERPQFNVQFQFVE